jgi:hypothetical protein
MIHQIGNLGDADPLRFAFAHAQGIGVIEAERARHCHADVGEGLANLLIIREIVAREDFLGDGAGVFGIEVDFAADEGIEELPLFSCPRTLITSRAARSDFSGHAARERHMCPRAAQCGPAAEGHDHAARQP